ncbi:MAG: hypothetical protein KDB03_19600 [Planctomycetales bacterium]|nr:hypothetical protein [Planctomycetales bacterium]
MTAVRLPRLSRPGVLESIANERLFALLRPYADFFASRAVPIETPDSIDCQAVIREITKADRDTPSDLLDAISLIDELANAVAVELLLDRIPAHSLGIERSGKHSAADIITAAWLSNPDKLVQTHALSRIKRVRSYDYFQASQTTAPKFVTPAEETIQQLERDIDSWHVERFRARGTRVEIFENDEEVEFSIMHGSLYRRQQVVENGRFGFQSFWPVQSASAIYNREFGELRINAKTGKEKALYCRLLGKHMFGNENLFPTGIKYTLDPLREFEFDALAPGSIEGISDVRMIELWLGDPDDRYGVITIRKGDDLLNWAQAKKKNIWLERRLISATFKMELLRPKRELAITVRPPNVAIYSRGPVAAIIEAWLTERGFIISPKSPTRTRHEPALAST